MANHYHIFLRFFFILVMSSTVILSFARGPSTKPSVQDSSVQTSSLSLSLFPPSEHPFLSWGIIPNSFKSDINLPPQNLLLKEKKPIVVAVIDTGIDPHHPFLKDNIHSMEGTTNIRNFGKDFSSSQRYSDTPYDDHGHGTHVSGIIRSIHPQVKILALKYFNPMSSGSENLSATIKALQYAIDKKVDIINYSGGGPEPSQEELNILKKAMEQNILVIAAAGNEHSNIDDKKNGYYPAGYGLDNIVSVTAHNQQGDLLPSSNWGMSLVDFSAPGFQIRSSLPYARSGHLTGTSQATAFATGLASLIKSRFPHLSAKDLKTILLYGGRKMAQMKQKNKIHGVMDAFKTWNALIHKELQVAFSPL
jgi:hypothetical protein